MIINESPKDSLGRPLAEGEAGGCRMTLAIVTATTNPDRAYDCFRSWGGQHFIGVVNGRSWMPAVKDTGDVGPLTRQWILSPDYLGTVPAFRLGVDYALEQTDADVIACLHDDLVIHEPDWVEKVLRYFARYPAMGLAGFGGAKGLGDLDLYQKPYAPQQLARVGFRSDLVDAEVHGIRSLLAEPVACLDGFSQIGRRAFWEGWGYQRFQGAPDAHAVDSYRPWTVLEKIGLRHHFYDGALGCLAARYGWQTWYIPVRAKHLGGQTAVGDLGYQTWATTQHPEGDHGLWKKAHQIGYDAFKDVLPLRV